MSLGTFPLPGGRQARVRYRGYVSKFKASGRVNKVPNIYLSGVYGASANDKRSNAPANDRALTMISYCNRKALMHGAFMPRLSKSSLDAN